MCIGFARATWPMSVSVCLSSNTKVIRRQTCRRGRDDRGEAMLLDEIVEDVGSSFGEVFGMYI